MKPHIVILALVALLVGCASPQAAPTPIIQTVTVTEIVQTPTHTPYPTYTPYPTLEPSQTPQPTPTPQAPIIIVVTATPVSDTPAPTKRPTNTPRPTNTSQPTKTPIPPTPAPPTVSYLPLFGHLFLNVEIYYGSGPNKAYAFKALGGSENCPSMPSGRGVLVLYKDGSTEWKDRMNLVSSGLYFVRRDDPNATSLLWDNRPGCR